jgi:hydroxymethylpyrimidine/phosphomethylpyrimidine kinase
MSDPDPAQREARDPGSPRAPRRVLTIAGSDSGGGAGIQADLKTFAAHGVYGLSAVTAVTAQNTVEVRAVGGVAPALVAAQIDAVLDDMGADAVKIGMLWSAPIVRVVAERLRVHFAPRQVPVVLDPVLAAGTGRSLLAAAGEAMTLVGEGKKAGQEGAAAEEQAGREASAAQEEMLAAMREELLPLVTLVTPNVPELARLVAAPVPAAGEAARLAMSFLLARRGACVLAKGGHDGGTAEVVDLLVMVEGGGTTPDWGSFVTSGPLRPSDLVGIPGGAGNGGVRVFRFSGRRLGRPGSGAMHGTGCTLAAAIAARLASGAALAAAVGGAVGYVRQAMTAALAAPALGGGSSPLAHFHGMSTLSNTSKDSNDSSQGTDMTIQELYGE